MLETFTFCRLMFNTNISRSALKARQRGAFTLSEVDGHCFQGLVTARQAPAEHVGHHHVPLGTFGGEETSPSCLWGFFGMGRRGPWLHRYPHWDTSTGLRGVQEELLGATSTQFREQSRGGPGPTVIQVTLRLAASFPFGGNKE